MVMFLYVWVTSLQSGKTTYIKTMSLLVIMSQIGFPLPCDYATISVRNSIFTRLGSDDDLQSNCSSFLMELRDMVHVLHAADENSLLIVDELGRGTAVSDGMALATSICEELIKRQVFVMFVTHFHRTIKYLNTAPCVNLVNLKTSESNGMFRYHYRAEEGICSEVDYGLKLAKSVGLPEELLSEASSIKSKLDASEMDSIENEQSLAKVVQKRKLVAETADKLRASGSQSAAVESIKREFYEKLESINQ